jgi:protein-S-isoprenylcysteine O-methyltransferase Ste14
MNMDFRITPPQLYKVCIGFMVLSLLLPMERRIHFPYNMIGVIFFIAGAIFALAAKRLFIKTNTPILPEATPEKLHTLGIFNYTRNPMYVGIVIGLIGIAVTTGFLVNLFFPFIYFIIMNIYFIKKEETNLENEFGERYNEYKKETRRWV